MRDLERMVAARDAAAMAWAMLSSAVLGPWASPHRKIPSLAKSTGRSFRCASRKKPSWVSGNFSFCASVLLPSRGTMPVESTSRSASILSFARRMSSITDIFTWPLLAATSGSVPSAMRMNRTPFSLASR